MKTSIKIPEKLVDAIDYLVNSADDEGCEGLVEESKKTRCCVSAIYKVKKK